jgi:small GTP-binding protein
VIQKKICLLGGFGVGKTSLVSRFVHSIFSDKYLTTLGVKIEKKSVAIDGGTVDLIIWDLHGEDDFQKLNMSYLRGSSGYLLVVDGTRKGSLDVALSLHDTAQRTIGKVPFMMAINKSDLADAWEIEPSALERLGFPIVRTSAKTGAEVEETFAALARAMAHSMDTHR